MDRVQLSESYRAIARRQFTFYHQVLRSFQHSFHKAQKDERLSRSWSHPVVLNPGPLRKSNALTTRIIASSNHLLNAKAKLSDECKRHLLNIHRLSIKFWFKSPSIHVQHIRIFNRLLWKILLQQFLSTKRSAFKIFLRGL